MSESDHKGSGFFSGLKTGLKASTILSKNIARAVVPENVIHFFRGLAEQGNDDPDLNKISNPYEHAKTRLNKIWRGREAFANDNRGEPATAVAQLTTLRGAITSYWTSEKWRSAWLKTGAIAGLATLGAQNAVWVAEATAGVIDAVSMMNGPDRDNVSAAIGDSLKWFGLFGGVQVSSAWAMAKLTGALERESSLWIKDRFKQAAFERHDIVQRISMNSEDKDAPDAMPDSPHQRMGDAPDQMMQGFVRMATNGYLAVLTSAFVGVALWNNSVSVEFLNGFGEQLNNAFPNAGVDFKEKGTAIAALGVISAYLGVTLPKGVSISRKIEKAYGKLQEHRSRMSEHLVNTFNRGDAIAASRGHKSAEKEITVDLEELNDAWKKENDTFSRYIVFMQGQSFIGHNIISILPSFASTFGKGGIFNSANPVQTFVETQGYVSALLGSMSYMVHILPQYAEMKAQARRVNEMAAMFEKASDKKAFLSLSGVHEFEYQEIDKSDNTLAMKLEGLELMFRGQNEAFLKAPELSINRGDWVHVKAPSGSGKTCLMKAAAGIWAHGRGDIHRRESDAVFYAFQEPDLSANLSLSDHLIYGMEREGDAPLSDTEKEKMKQALQESGLGGFADYLDDRGMGGKTWGKIFSGGQKQRLVLTRILFQEPDIILLDEPTSALDPEARAMFFDKLDQYSGRATVLAITHDENIPSDDNGMPYFNKRLSIENGIANISDIHQEPAQDYVLQAAMLSASDNE